MLRSYGGFLLTFERARTESFAEILSMSGEGAESFSAEDWDFERKELVFLARRHPTSIFAFALMSRMGGSGGTRRIKMRFTNPVLFEPPISANEAIGGAELSKAISTAESLNRIAPETWKALISVVKQLRPNSASEIDRLVELRTQDGRLLNKDRRTDVLSQQRDSIGLILDIAELDRHGIFRKTSGASALTASSAIDLLDAQPVAERSLIEYDQSIFETLLSTTSKSVQFEDSRGFRVRAYVSDQTPLETATGVDLYLYQERFDSFLLLQYKGMERNSHDAQWNYVIDGSNVIEQLAAMDQVRTAVPAFDHYASTVQNQRLFHDPFYFKFCERTRPNAKDESLVAGITLSALHLKEFLSFPEATVNGRSRHIGYGNCPRYLNNTEFVTLARNGWIGSRGASSQLITRILAAREGGRSAIFAVIQGPALQAKTKRRKGFNIHG